MPKIGLRLWKTGLAVALTVAIVRVVSPDHEVYGAVAAAMAVAPTAVRSLKSFLKQVGANVLGGLVGLLAILLLGPHPLVIGGAVVVVLLLCQVLGRRDVSSVAVTVTLFVMAPHSETVSMYVLNRLISVMIGSLTGTAVNALVMAPDYWPAAVEAVMRAGDELDFYLMSISKWLHLPDAYTKSEVLAGGERVEALLSEARRLTLLLEESHRPGHAPGRKEVLQRSIKVLGSLLERIQVIHKAALSAQRLPEYQQQIEEIQAAITALIEYRQKVYGMLSGNPPAPSLMDGLLEIERRFDTSIDLPERSEEVEAFFWFYRVRASVSHMANRLQRLYVKIENSLPRQEQKQLFRRSAVRWLG